VSGLVERVPGSDTRQSRRSVVFTGLAAGAFGSAWFTGLAALARGIHPQILAVGNGDWQILLVEHRARRALILVGDTTGAQSDDVSRLLGGWRFGVDVLAGSAAAIAGLSDQTLGRLAPPLTIDLDTEGSSRSGTRQVIGDGLALDIGVFHIRFIPLPATAPGTGRSWIAHLAVDGLIVAVAPALETIGDQGALETTLAVAPTGDIRYAGTRLPQAAIVTNQSRIAGIEFDLATKATTNLVRTYPNDPARLEFRDGHLRLPAWTTMVSLS
jgi:hypothetical protein